MNKKIYIIIFLFSLSGILSAQQNDNFLDDFQEIDALLTNAASYYKDEDKLEVNQEVKTLLKSVLESPNSFDAPVDSLKRISVLKSPDGNLRLFTWNLLFDDLTHTCYGFIQYQAEKDKLLLYELKDFYILRDSMERKYSSHAEWYGAIYYDIIQKTDNKSTVYTLLGWRGRNALTQQKIVETLEFDRHNLPNFGKKRMRIGRSRKLRAVYTYSIKTQMILRFNEKQDIIVLDHLSPSDPKLEGYFEYYGPDYSYDAFEFDKGFWYFVSDIDPERAINFERDKEKETLRDRKPSTEF
ncbi:MAG: hypothetical protein PF448_04805 [Bacteroidales bacterium]|jgi:hypothetical protein|nr:hypothetical protein [Bacteroidales bacterium]